MYTHLWLVYTIGEYCKSVWRYGILREHAGLKLSTAAETAAFWKVKSRVLFALHLPQCSPRHKHRHVLLKPLYKSSPLWDMNTG